NMIRLSTLFLGWRARRAGTSDGRTLIPHPHDVPPPTYLFYLRSIGDWRAAMLAWRWQLHNLALFTAYIKASRMHEQANQLLDEVAGEYADAEARRNARGTDKHIKALHRCWKARERARRYRDRAELAVARARARRQAKWEGYGARFHALAAEMDHYMQVYSDANVKARDDNDCPPGLLEANRPRLEIPMGLRALDWGLPARTARRGANASSMDA
ncbi:MAG: hypothetical protein JWN15_1570, partial [Firmicutes bacterium]|nr:hypothetical protein [Bacillota bacterium]